MNELRDQTKYIYSDRGIGLTLRKSMINLYVLSFDGGVGVGGFSGQ